AAVERALPQVALAIDAIADAIRSGGRLVYVGAGTSGRLAALDAAECEPTFGIEVTALLAGEDEAAEDDATAGSAMVGAAGIGAGDAIVGISASGRSPFVVAALESARSRGALTGCIVCVAGSELAAMADHEVCVLVGAG